LNLAAGRSFQEMKLNRRSSWISALALLAGLAFSNPSQAGSVVSVSESFGITNTAFADSITSVTFGFTGLDGISDTMFTGSATKLTGGPGSVSPTISFNAVAQTVTLTFSPGVFTVGGGISFNTNTTTVDAAVLASTIKLTSLTIVSPNGPYAINTDALHFTVVNAVPEPTSSAMFGLGIVLAVGLGWGRKRRELKKLAV
jgi:hypothetical protein